MIDREKEGKKQHWESTRTGGSIILINWIGQIFYLLEK